MSIQCLSPEEDRKSSLSRVLCERRYNKRHAELNTRQHKHTSAYVSIRQHAAVWERRYNKRHAELNTRQHTSAYVSIQQCGRAV